MKQKIGELHSVQTDEHGCGSFTVPYSLQGKINGKEYTLYDGERIEDIAKENGWTIKYKSAFFGLQYDVFKSINVPEKENVLHKKQTKNFSSSSCINKAEEFYDLGVKAENKQDFIEAKKLYNKAWNEAEGWDKKTYKDALKNIQQRIDLQKNIELASDLFNEGKVYKAKVSLKRAADLYDQAYKLLPAEEKRGYKSEYDRLVKSLETDANKACLAGEEAEKNGDLLQARRLYKNARKLAMAQDKKTLYSSKKSFVDTALKKQSKQVFKEGQKAEKKGDLNNASHLYGAAQPPAVQQEKKQYQSVQHKIDTIIDQQLKKACQTGQSSKIEVTEYAPTLLTNEPLIVQQENAKEDQHLKVPDSHSEQNVHEMENMDDASEYETPAIQSETWSQSIYSMFNSMYTFFEHKYEGSELEQQLPLNTIEMTENDTSLDFDLDSTFKTEPEGEAVSKIPERSANKFYY